MPGGRKPIHTVTFDPNYVGSGTSHYPERSRWRNGRFGEPLTDGVHTCEAGTLMKTATLCLTSDSAITGDTTLYAQWTANKYAVSLNEESRMNQKRQSYSRLPMTHCCQQTRRCRHRLSMSILILSRTLTLKYPMYSRVILRIIMEQELSITTRIWIRKIIGTRTAR